MAVPVPRSCPYPAVAVAVTRCCPPPAASQGAVQETQGAQGAAPARSTVTHTTALCPELPCQSSLQQTALGLLIYCNEKGKGQAWVLHTQHRSRDSSGTTLARGPTPLQAPQWTLRPPLDHLSVPGVKPPLPALLSVSSRARMDLRRQRVWRGGGVGTRRVGAVSHTRAGISLRHAWLGAARISICHPSPSCSLDPSTRSLLCPALCPGAGPAAPRGGHVPPACPRAQADTETCPCLWPRLFPDTAAQQIPWQRGHAGGLLRSVLWGFKPWM